MKAYLRTKKQGKCYYCLLKWREGGKQRSKEISTEVPVKGSNKRRAQEVCEELRQKYERLYESNGVNVSDTLFTDYIEEWLNNQKVNLKSTDRYRHLSDEQKARLDAIGMVWSCRQAAWDVGYVHAEEYLKQLNGKAWKTNYVSPDGYKTGEWLRNQVRAKQKGKLSPESEKLLKKIGLQFEKEHFKKNERKRRSSQTITQGLTP